MEERQAALRTMRICRFCLSEKDPMTNIYERDNNYKNAIPLPLQIMACVTIEVFANDGMPQLICDDCRLQTRRSYAFKTMCKKSDDALKLFLATGVLKRQEKEEILKTRPILKRTNELHIQTSAQKRAKPNVNNEFEPGQVEPIIRTKIIRTENNQQNLLHPEPFICEVTEEAVEQGEIPQSEVPENSKQVVTHCFSCSHCERSFPLQQLLDIHMRQHNRERKFSCSECGKKFFSKHDLHKHVKLHSGDKPFSCVVCEKSFSRATLLHRHEKVHATVQKYPCNYCEKSYLTSEDLNTHLMSHQKRRPFKCGYCDKSFAYKQGLDRHILSHNSDNLHKCDYCEESFTTAQKLSRHVTTHAGDRPYPCKLCPRTFLLSHHLSRHLRNHYNQRSMENEFGNYKCEFCSMSFRRKDSLINHTAIHSMVNLKCVICNKEFGNAKTVKEHVSTHLASLPYPCDKCDYSFETQEELEDHEVKHVDDDDDNDDNELEEDEYVADNSCEQIMHFDHEIEEQEDAPIRRSLRESKIKNYAEFLKDEIESDSEENIDEQKEETQEVSKVQIGSIQPVIRSETIKMYKGVKLSNTNIQEHISPHQEIQQENDKLETNNTEATEIEPGQIAPAEPVLKTPKSVTKITTLENLGISKQTLDAMTEKSGFVEMKLGQKVIRVQKLMMTKAEYQAMSKNTNTKLEVKGGTVVVQNEGNLDIKKFALLTKTVVHDPATDTKQTKLANQPNIDSSVNRTPIRTYVKRTVIKKEDLSQDLSFNEDVTKDVTETYNIDLTNSIDESATMQETEILNRY